MLGYSTEERWTGKYWTDGKKIYSRVHVFNSLQFFEQSSGSITIPGVLTNNEETIISGFLHGFRNSDGTIPFCTALMGHSGNNTNLQAINLFNIYLKSVSLEYTKISS